MIALIRIFLAALLLASPAELLAADSPSWFTRMLVGLEVGPTGSQFGGDPADVGYTAKFDGRAERRVLPRRHSRQAGAGGDAAGRAHVS